ncbi:xanthine dehydrogenase family protein molybdopterin-binding subunit [Flavihumibacter petaseus]|uniref:Putative oxidoreductase n=1 Tax=Flavihumibacter petaseus NBRC 106054 TaxID=1220578 RepID=A0A0E9N381_9BACT|nr:molybdopterin cofactor-binding domain-containing protein [Flavihumibacter petaseus]GAO44417.1 putative oxidoreductase [Flavihumibacter petaseus NBRC 106054]
MKNPPGSISRRNFLRISGMTGASLTIGFLLPAAAKDIPAILTAGEALEQGIELSAWVSIDKTGLVTIMCHRAEMGQGAFQAIPQIVAEELEVEFEKINVMFAAGQTRYGSQITGGSSTVRGGYQNMLRAGATAREMLITAAANSWKVKPEECYAEKGKVFHRSSGKSLGYGELVEPASKLKLEKPVTLKQRKDYKLIGKPVKRLDTSPKSNGKAIFGIDFRVKGLLYASVERSPYFHGKIKSIDDKKAKAIKGVKHIVKVEMPVFAGTRHGVAVVADSIYTAMKARKALVIEWDNEGFEKVSTELLYNRMRADVQKTGLTQKAQGDPTRVIGKDDKKITAVYETPYESHSAMEPLNCTAHYTAEKIEVWGPIQGPDWVQGDLADKFKMPKEKVIVNMTFLGGGFGRKAFLDYTYEAVALSKAIGGPVQIVWTREDDMTQGPFRPGGVYGCSASLSDGRLQALEIKMAAQNMDHQWVPVPDKADYNRNTMEGWLEPYLEQLSHYRFADIPTESPIPVMWWRSVYSSTNVFAFESFWDELSVAAGKDPLAMRREHISQEKERYHKLFDAIAALSGWDKRGKNEGWGIAVSECFGSIVGEVVKVSARPGGGVKVDKVFAVMDCGWYVNPDIIRAQIEGSIIMAYGAAAVHATHFADGKAVERNFHQYAMPRIMDTPEIIVQVMDNDEKPGGVGEPSLPPFAPALCNAIFDLTGKRIRKLPMDLTAI